VRVRERHRKRERERETERHGERAKERETERTYVYEIFIRENMLFRECHCEVSRFNLKVLCF
jgi:hypothetical protein